MSMSSMSNPPGPPPQRRKSFIVSAKDSFLACFGITNRDKTKPNIRIINTLTTLLALQSQISSAVGAREGAAASNVQSAKDAVKLERELNDNYAQLIEALDSYINHALKKGGEVPLVYQSYFAKLPRQEQRRVVLDAFLQAQAPGFLAKMGENPNIAAHIAYDPNNTSSFRALGIIYSIAQIMRVEPQEGTFLRLVFDGMHDTFVKLYEPSQAFVNEMIAKYGDLSQEKYKEIIKADFMIALAKHVNYDFFEKVQTRGTLTSEDRGLPESLHKEIFSCMCLFVKEYETQLLAELAIFNQSSSTAAHFNASDYFKCQTMIANLYRSLLSPSFVQGLISTPMDPRLKASMWEMFGRALEYEPIRADVRSIGQNLELGDNETKLQKLEDGVKAIATMGLPDTAREQVGVFLQATRRGPQQQMPPDI